MVYDAIVAGAGLWGCTIARRLAESGQRVLVLEKRKAVGGNCRCRTEKGIEVHLYGSHIFHKSNEEVWKFINRFVSFNAEAAPSGGKLIVGGRLGEYRYYDMDKSIAAALAVEI